MKTLPKIATVIVCLCSVTHVLRAQVPPLINYQGRAVVGTTNFDGSGQFKFALVNAAGTTTYWSNDGTSVNGAEPTAAVTLTVTKGLYSVRLGDNSIANMTALPGTVFTNSDVRLRVWFNDGPHGSQLLTPDQRLAAVGYAFMADNIKDGAITSAKLASGLTLAGTTTGTFNGSLAGNASTATTATSATNFTGSLAGNVTGTQGSTVVAFVGGVTAANVASGASLANAATNANTANAIVKRDASGNFSAGTITASLNGNASTATSATSATTATSAGSATNFSGSLAGQVTGGQNTTSILDTVVTGKALTGFSSTTGTITASDTVLSAINKLNGNDALKAPLISPSFTGAINIPATVDANNGVIKMAGTALISAPGLQNVFFGNGAGNFTFVGDQNTGAGVLAMNQMTGGSFNSGVGYAALYTNGGSYNTGMGYKTLYFNTGTFNTATGSEALFNNTGDRNTAHGSSALKLNTVGINNTAMGFNALLSSTGSNNIGIGYSGGSNVTTGNNNIDIGNFGGAESNTIRIGTAGTHTATYLAGVINGDGSALTNVSATNVGGVTAANVASGANLANAATNANIPSAIVKRDASGNFSAGTITAALNGNASTATTATASTTATNFSGSLSGNVIGTQGATFVSTVGGVTAANVASGANLANAATDANTASAIVKRDASGNFSANIITANGSALSNLNASNISSGTINNGRTSGASSNTPSTLVLRDASGNFSAGTIASDVINIPATTSSTNGVIQMAGTSLISAKGTQNIFLGNGAGSFTVTGQQNTAAGVLALQNISSGSLNTAMGYRALISNTNGSSSTAVGFEALINAGSGANNIALGAGAGQSLTSGSNNIYIGNDGGASESNVIRIGSSQTATVIKGISGATAPGGAAVFVTVSGQLGTTTSSRRFKTDIKPMEDASSVLLSLKPVTFRYKPEIDANAIPQFGLIAEEVAEICPDLVIRDEKGELQTVRYEQVNAMLLNEFLKEHRRIADLREENATLRNENAANATRLATLEARDKEREARLTRIEMSIPPAQAVSNTIAGTKAGDQ